MISDHPPGAAAAAQPAASPGSAVPMLRLRRGEDRRLRAGHQWVFANEVDVAATPLTAFKAGDHARIHDWREQFIGFAYVNPHALICARIMSRDPQQPIGHALLVRRLEAALRLRTRYFPAPCYRLVFGESDGLPGLVLDRYGDTLVGQIATAGMEALRPAIEAAIDAVLAPANLVWKNDGGARALEQLPAEILCARGALPETLQVSEGELRFSAPMAGAQKTGWFYDQSANRELFRRLLWPDVRVLDVCSYLGAWSVTALRSGAREAWCVDASAAALEGATANAARNGVALRTLRGDAFEVLEQLHGAGERFDVVVLDPPAFIKRRKDMPRGQAAYRKLNQMAMRLLAPEALLVSCSCSYHLGADELAGLIQAAARHANREVQILAAGGQGCDHPVHPAIPESRYLKAFFCRVTHASG
jgi:23S rRNA (cytosine1962-C5)-methyltransferase